MTTLFIITSFILLAILIVFLLFLLIGVYSISDSEPTSNSLSDASVITAVRNDDRIHRLDNKISHIKHDAEWVVVDDASSKPVHPTNADVLIRIHYRPEGRRKKQALRSGIRLSKGQTLAFIDADCVPSNQWLSRIVSPIFKGEADFVYGHSVMKGKGIGSRTAMFDHWLNSLLTFGMAGHGYHYNASGRSMAIKREVFFKTGEFKGHEDLPSGDDDLLLHEALQRGYKIKAIVSKTAVVFTEAPKTILSLVNQRARHVQTSFLYPWRIKLFLSTFWLAYFGSLIMSLTTLSFDIMIGFSLLVSRWLFLFLFMALSSPRLLYKANPFIPATDLLLFFVYIMVVFKQIQGCLNK